MEAIEELLGKINRYKRKHFLTQISKGLMIWGIFAILSLLSITLIEHFLWLGTEVRAVLFFGFLASNLYLFAFRVGIPSLGLFNIYRPLGNLEAARMLGGQNQEIKDKLVNTLQIQDTLSRSNSSLAEASVLQRSNELQGIDFLRSISWNKQRGLALFFSLPFSILIFVLFFQPDFITNSGARLINFNKEYLPPAPFDFNIVDLPEHGFRNEDLAITLILEGTAIPQDCFAWVNGDKRKMARRGPGLFGINLKRVQKDMDLRFEAGGFYSSNSTIMIHNRPVASGLQIEVDYPSYTRWPDKTFSSMGQLRVPTGTRLTWKIENRYTNEIAVSMDSIENFAQLKPKNGAAEFSKSFFISSQIEFLLKNEFGRNREPLRSKIDVVPDQYPKVALKALADSTLFQYIILAGEISDDYGFSQFKVKYNLKGVDGLIRSSGSRSIQINKSLADQSYFLRWDTEKLGIRAGERLEYYVEVVDNDGVNGPKSTRSEYMSLVIPSKKELIAELDKRKEDYLSSSSSSRNSLEKLQKDIKEFQDETRNKKELNWQDKKRLEELLEKHKEMENEIEGLKKELSEIQPQEEKYLDQKKKILEKSKQLEKLMEQVLDEETKKLLEELMQLLENQEDNSKIQNKLTELERKDSQYEKELERAIELFKQLRFDQKLDQAIQEINELAEEQEKLANETMDRGSEKEQLSENQEELGEKFEDFEESLESLEKLDKDLESPRDFAKEDFQEDLQEIQENMDQSEQMIDSGKKNKAGQNQKEGSKKMEQLAQEMMQFQSESEMKMLAEDIKNLRALLENLIHLSFEQERIMKEFRRVRRADPRYIDLSQEQLKLQNDARIVEDSLYALASRIFQIEAFVTKEVEELNYQMDESIRLIRERRGGKATIRQQFAMTSVNNLALMLDNVLQQLQEQMASQMQGDQMCSKPNGKKPSPSLSQMQSELNQKIRALKKAGKQGKELSEELSRLAQQQESIRESMKQLGGGGNQLDKDLKKQLQDLAMMMEQSEKDLVHKRLSRELLERQSEIETRLLESENSDRERELKEERESELAQDHERAVPPEIEEYIKTRESQIELLKTINPSLNPYFKDKVNQYFERLNFETGQGSN